MISGEPFDGLDEEEKRLWHSHDYEVSKETFGANRFLGDLFHYEIYVSGRPRSWL